MLAACPESIRISTPPHSVPETWGSSSCCRFFAEPERAISLPQSKRLKRRDDKISNLPSPRSIRSCKTSTESFEQVSWTQGPYTTNMLTLKLLQVSKHAWVPEGTYANLRGKTMPTRAHARAFPVSYTFSTLQTMANLGEQRTFAACCKRCSIGLVA